MMSLAMVAGLQLSAQDHTVKLSNPSQTTLIIKEVNKVSVEAYEGSEIQIEADSKRDQPERAAGLTALSARGKDNTGIGLNVQQDGDQVTIFQASRRGKGRYVIKVPKSVNVQIEHTGNWEGGKIEVYGLAGELEISGRYNSVYMEEVSGPALVNTVHGKVEAIFSKLNQDSPTSLVSVHGIVDVTLPADTKADVILKTPYGEAFSDMDIQFGDEEGGMRKVSSTIKGKLNGGGVELDLKASYNNIYLRKK
ncbi:MAG: hypothetical protein Roseis2KO_20640 [Roseivirga sp.]